MLRLSLFVFVVLSALLASTGCMSRSEDEQFSAQTPIVTFDPTNTIAVPQEPEVSLATPSLTPTPTATNTVTATPLPTSTPTATPLAQAGVELTTDNVDQLESLRQWGDGHINSVSVSRDESFLALAMATGFCLVELDAPANKNCVETDEQIEDVAFLPGNQSLAALEAGGQLYLWNEGKLTTVDGTALELEMIQRGKYWKDQIVTSIDGELIAFYQNEQSTNTSRILLLDTVENRMSLEIDEDDGVHGIDLSPNGDLLAYGIGEEVSIWNVAAESEVARLALNTYSSSVAFLPDGSELIVESWGAIETYETSGWSQVASTRVSPYSLDRLAVSRDGSFLFIIEDNILRVWDHANDQKAYSHVAATDIVDIGHLLGSQQVIVATQHDVYFWNLESDAIEPIYDSGSYAVSGQAFSPSGAFIGLASGDGIILQDVGGNRTWKLIEHQRPVFKVVLSPDGRQAVAIDTKTAIQWDILTEESTILPGGNNIYLSAPVRFSPSGKYIGTIIDYRAAIIDSFQGTIEQTLEPPAYPKSYLGSIDFAPNRDVLASTGAEELAFWDLASGFRIISTSVDDDDYLSNALFSPDGAILAVTVNNYADVNDIDYSVRITNAYDGTFYLRRGFLYEVESIVFSPNNELFVAGSCDGFAHFFDRSTWQEVLALRAGNGCIDGLAFSRDGTMLASSSAGIVNIWGIPAQNEAEQNRLVEP